MTLAEVCLLTNDVPRLSAFYKKVLATTSDCDDVTHQVILVNGGAVLTIYNDGTEKNNSNQNICIAFTVENVDEEYERLKKFGVTVIEPPTTRPWGARNMHFCDPDGNHVYFRSFPTNTTT